MSFWVELFFLLVSQASDYLLVLQVRFKKFYTSNSKSRNQP